MSAESTTCDQPYNFTPPRTSRGAAWKRPVALPPRTERIPAELRERTQWVCWSYSKILTANGPSWQKIPVSPQTGIAAKVNRPDTWSSLDAAMNRWRSRRADGVGFVLSKEDP